MLKRMGYLLVWLIFLTSCGEDSNQPDVLLPSDLQVEVVLSEQNPGQVSVVAVAKNTNFYRFYFEEGESYVEEVSGKASYFYTTPGAYTIQVQAHATTLDYVSNSVDVVIPEVTDDIPDDGYTTPEEYEGMTLMWRDEFEGPELNLKDWTYEIGTGNNGWGNNELQYYTDRNVTIVDGKLRIQARKEPVGGSAYTSSRIVTQNKQSFKYGRVDIRAKLPEGQGLWPALWMLGSSFATAGWPACGEIDIMEMVGGSGRENTVHGTVHWLNNNEYASFGKDYSYGGSFADKFHVFTILWDSQSITWLVDDKKFNEVDITPEGLTEFRESFFFIFNVAVGGNWPGSPDTATQFPQAMEVDYIRVFQ